MNEIVIGSCSLCGGDVVLPKLWWSVIEPVARCKKCGATAKQNKRRIIPMGRHTEKYVERWEVNNG